jgi:multidrug efflux system membrane fusion protein
VTPPERVVTTGFARLTDGGKVSISNADGAPAPAGARARGGKKGERQQGGGARPAAAPTTTPP